MGEPASPSRANAMASVHGVGLIRDFAFTLRALHNFASKVCKLDQVSGEFVSESDEST